MTRAAAALLTLIALALGACGSDSEPDTEAKARTETKADTKEEDAFARVCDSRADINREVETLHGLTLAEATSGQVGESLRAIREDVRTIRDAQPDLADDRRRDVQAANDAFAAEVRDIAAGLGTGLSREDAADQLRTAADKLAGKYRETYGRIDCPGG